MQDYLGVLVEELDPFVDVFLGETLSLIAEAEAVERAVSATRKPFWISFTLQDEPGAEAQPPALRSGESVADAARWVANSTASALLFNCSRPEVMRQAIDVAAAILAQSGRPVEIGVYANAFAQEGEAAANEALHAIRDDLSANRYASFAREWAESGATLIGGCCGVGASHIHNLRQRFK